MTRVVLHNYLSGSTRSVGRFRTTAPVHDHGEGGACHCGGSCDVCKTHGHDEVAPLKVDLYMQQVCSALNSYGAHVQQLAKRQFQEGASVQEAIKHIRRSNGAFDAQSVKDIVSWSTSQAQMSEALAREERTRLRATLHNKEVDLKKELARGNHVSARFIEREVAQLKKRLGEGSRDAQYAKAELGIDVIYTKGGYGRPKITETRHYTVPNVGVDPRGHAPQPAFVMGQLRAQPEHRGMVKDGWTPEKVEGYYKREQRDVGRRLV